jgi:sec-independent protein translocase protein TatB
MFPEGRIFELVIVFAVALVVVGPKDLPIMMRKVGRFVAHMRGMAAEFRASFDEMARQTELDELRKEVEAMKSGRSIAGFDADSHTQGVFDDIHASLRSDGSAPPAPVMTAIEPPTNADEPELPMAMPLAPAPPTSSELPAAQVLS